MKCYWFKPGQRPCRLSPTLQVRTTDVIFRVKTMRDKFGKSLRPLSATATLDFRLERKVNTLFVDGNTQAQKCISREVSSVMIG